MARTITAQDIINNYLAIQLPRVAEHLVDIERDYLTNHLTEAARTDAMDYEDMTPAEWDDLIDHLRDRIDTWKGARYTCTELFVAHTTALTMLSLGHDIPEALATIVTTS